MTSSSGLRVTQFDDYAANYDTALAQGLSVSGEEKEFFAVGRIRWLAGRLRRLGVHAGRVLDFGCGMGSAAPLLLEHLGADSVLGVDVSANLLERARNTYSSERTQFALLSDYRPAGTIDVAFCNGVFHHIPVDQRPSAIDVVYQSLRPGGLFALWENNPWSLGARLVMSRIPFDRDAVMVWPRTARRLLREGGFEVLGTDFLFIFPRTLRGLRPIEPYVCRLPLGAQYQVLGRRPERVAVR
jgi:SAM-dependent methyltransferase